MQNILEFETVDLDIENNELIIIDQTLLPGRIEILRLTEAKDIWDAIHELKVRGAPAIGVAAAMGLYILSCRIKASDSEEFYTEFVRVRNYLDSSRPTAVNLHWALMRMDSVVKNNMAKTPSEIIDALRAEAVAIKEEDIAVCKAIGEYGLTLIQDG